MNDFLVLLVVLLDIDQATQQQCICAAGSDVGGKNQVIERLRGADLLQAATEDLVRRETFFR